MPQSYTYDDYNRVLTVTTPLPEPLGTATTQFKYHPIHTLDEALSPYLHTTRAVSKITSPTGIATAHWYDFNFRRTQTIQGGGTPDAATTNYGYDETGNLTSVTDPRTHVTTIDYDGRNRRTKVTGPPMSDYGDNRYVTEWLYDPASNVREIILPDQSKIYRDYDEVNRLLTNDLRDISEQENRVTQYSYWPSGRLKTVTIVKPPADQITAFDYDERDLKTKMTYPDGTVLQSWLYDGNGNMLQRPTIGGPIQVFTYDDRNRLKTMRWSNGIDFSDFDYDEAGRLKSAINPYSAVTREYDEGGRLKLDRQILAASFNTPAITITPVGVVSRKHHGATGNFDISLPLTDAPGIECRNGPNYTLVLTFADPVTVGGATVSSGIGSVSSVGANGNIVTVNLNDVSNAQVITIKVFGLFDGTNAGDLTIPMHVLIGDTMGHGVVNSGDSSQTGSRSGQVTNASNFRSDLNADGIINSADVATVSLNAGIYEPMDRVSAPQADVHYEYDADGKLEILSVLQTNYYFEYHYDGMGRLKTILDPPPSHEYYKYSYDASSNVSGRMNCTDNTCFSSLVFGHDELNRIKEETILLGNYPLSHLQYRYDSMNRLVSTLRDEDGLMDRFGYSFTGELNSAEYGLHADGQGGYINPTTATSYIYDKAGNRQLVNGASYTPNSLNQYTWAEGIAVANGPQHEIATYPSGVNYTYLGDTHLAAVHYAANDYQLGYDALGRTVRRTSNSQRTYFVYDGPHSILEYDANGSVTGTTLYGLGVDEIIVRDNNGARQFLMQDQMGSTVAVTGPNVNLLEKYRYDAFGTPKIMDPDGTVLTDSAINNRFLFAGREWVSRFSFYENRARAYHPGLGRFMSEDPMGFAAGDSNLFRYCGNDPVNYVDPFGGDAVILRSGPVNNHINVRYPVFFYGFSPAQQGLFIRGAQSYFNHQFGQYDVTLSIGAPTLWESLTGVTVNRVYPTTGTSTSSGMIIWWNPRDGALGAGHEVGHSSGATHSGDDENDLMSGPNVRPNENSSFSIRDIEKILDSNGRGVTGHLFDALFSGRRVWFGQNGNGGTMYNSGSGWEPIGGAPADIRWLPGVTGNFNADQATKNYLLGGGENFGEGSHSVPFELN